jgi:hypothetical protein
MGSMKKKAGRFKRSEWIVRGVYALAGLLMGWLMGRRWLRQLRFPQLRAVQQGLQEKHGEVEAAFLAGRVQQRYEELYIHRPLFRNPRVQVHINRNVLPALALYQVLVEQCGDRQRALLEVQKLLLQVLMSKGRLVMRLLHHVPDPFAVLRRAVRLVNKAAFPAPAWDMTYLVDDGQVIAFEIHDCLYVNVLAAYGVPELAQIFCQVDDALAANFPAGISWERESTLARGGQCCDFRYARAPQMAGSEE